MATTGEPGGPVDGRPVASQRATGGPSWFTAVLVTAVIVVGVGGLVAFSGDDTAIGLLPIALGILWLATIGVVAVLRRGRLLAALLIVTTVVVAIGIAGAPAKLRARLSQSQLAAASARVEAGESVNRVGLYWPDRSWYDDDRHCAVFATQSFFIDTSGVAYCSGAALPTPGDFEHLVGNVYSYSDSD